jgi:hypothetical protein
MDGQQRITAIRDFYANSFKLRGLETWPELNGRTYSTLPEKIRAGIDRRSITSIVLLKESTESEEEASLLRETVFDRLNTGGIKLERQEITNALYRGSFNDMLHEITRSDDFREIWGLPRWVEGEIETNPALVADSFFAKMADAEVVLRFFALRHVDHYRRGMQGFLDLYMRRAAKFSAEDVAQLKEFYQHTLHLAREIYSDLVFRPYSTERNAWDLKPHRAFQDAVMIGLSECLADDLTLKQRSFAVIEATKQLFEANPDGTFTGRGNTKQDIEDRIDLYRGMLSNILG